MFNRFLWIFVFCTSAALKICSKQLSKKTTKSIGIYFRNCLFGVNIGDKISFFHPVYFRSNLCRNSRGYATVTLVFPLLLQHVRVCCLRDYLLRQFRSRRVFSRKTISRDTSNIFVPHNRRSILLMSLQWRIVTLWSQTWNKLKIRTYISCRITLEKSE